MDLHGQIMNLPGAGGLSEIGTTRDEQLAYRRGHRDARHAAAELANENDAEIAALRKDAERYRWLRSRMDDCAAEVCFAPRNAEFGDGWVKVSQDVGSGAALDDALDTAMAGE